ncbi:hypothetical protein L0244_07500, partial [bacterium]|nr:hypothetical protein [bacterium]
VLDDWQIRDHLHEKERSRLRLLLTISIKNFGFGLCWTIVRSVIILDVKSMQLIKIFGYSKCSKLCFGMFGIDNA